MACICRRWLAFMLSAALLLCGVSFAESVDETTAPAVVDGMAQDISKDCFYNGVSGECHKLTDKAYAHYWKSVVAHNEHYLIITAPQDVPMASLYIQWRYDPVDIDLQVRDENGEWTTIMTHDGEFFAELIELPDLQQVRIIAKNEPIKQMAISELTVFTAGTLPDYVQRWEKPGDKVDMMMLVGHPDDEIIWFGGLLPTYAGEMQKDVLVICAAMSVPYRRLQLLDCLWTCGVRIHPIYSVLYDFSTTSAKDVFKEWNKDRCLKMYTEYYRRYKPDVVILQDVNGEYGHGAHKAVSQLGRECAQLAADPEQYPQQVQELGTWDVPKIYIHLYEENQLTMDWHQPLEHFGGMTAQDVAREAFAQHKSQQGHGYDIWDGGKYDNELYGLYRTKVGLDEEKNDFFEHID